MENKKTKKKKVGIIFVSIIAVIVIIITSVGIVASKNMKVMNDTLEAGLQVLSENYKVTPVDAGEFKEIKMYGIMKFDVAQYDIEELGNLSIMKTNMGIMQMVSFIISPYEKNMPLLSMDFMYPLGKRKDYVEMYDLVSDASSPEYAGVLEKMSEFKEKYSSLADIDVEPAWYEDLLTVDAYKVGKRADDETIKNMFCDVIEKYAETAKSLDNLSDEEKTEKIRLTQEYCDNLITKGGVSTDVFKKALGEDTTKNFFDKVFFGTESYK